MNELTQRGIAALKAGDRAAARQWLGSAIRQDPADMQAWFWLSGAVDRDEERFDCLRQVLRLDPGNPSAVRGITQILERNPHLRPKAAGVLAPPPPQPDPLPPPNEPAAEEEDLLARAVLPVISQPAVSESRPLQERANQPEAARPAEITATRSPAQGANGHVITPIYPRRLRPAYSTLRPVFSARPSLVPVILYFWLVMFSLYGLLILFGEEIQQLFPTVVALAALCGLVVIYMLIRLFTIHYELTNQYLALPFHGKQVNVPISAILKVETEQTAFQKLLGTGDILIDAGLNGVLTKLRIRNIPQVAQRAEQILFLVREM